MNTGDRQPLRPRAPLTPSQAALNVRPFGVGSFGVDPVQGYLVQPDNTPVSLDSETMLLLVMLAADAGRTITDGVIGATVWPTLDDPSPPAATAVEALRGLLGPDSIEQLDGGYKLTSPVSIDANDSGFWLPTPWLGEQIPAPVTTTVIRTGSWNPILILPVVVVLLLVVLFLLR